MRVCRGGGGGGGGGGQGIEDSCKNNDKERMEKTVQL